MVREFVPHTLGEALQIRKDNEVTLYAGGTDLMVEAKEDVSYLFINKLEELKGIKREDGYIKIGAGTTFTEIIESNVAPKLLKDAVSKIAAPAIRNNGTIGGNICNGSPKADSALIFFVTDSKLRLRSLAGERTVSIKDFYLGRNKTDLRSDEILVEVLMPDTEYDYYYEKVGGREALAISRISFAGIFVVKDGVINHLATAFGAVSDTVIRRDDIDSMLIGKTVEEAKSLSSDYLKAMDNAIIATRGRVSADYRKEVCRNLLKEFLENTVLK